MQSHEFGKGDFFFFFFNLRSFFPSRSPQILSSFFLPLCQLLPGNFFSVWRDRAGHPTAFSLMPAPSPSNLARHPRCSPKGCAHHSPPLHLPLSSAPLALGTQEPAGWQSQLAHPQEGHMWCGIGKIHHKTVFRDALRVALWCLMSGLPLADN